MAPEQANGETHLVDGRSDVRAMGVILYRMVTGHLPFHGSSRSRVFDAICHQEAEEISKHDPTIPQELTHIVSAVSFQADVRSLPSRPRNSQKTLTLFSRRRTARSWQTL